MRKEKLNFNHLYYFWTISREMSVTRGARILEISQPSASSQLAVLETSLGFNLFKSHGRGIVLTEKGATLFAYCS